MRGQEKPTLASIGAKVGVSPSTVSMILNGREGVSFSEETVRRVRQTAQELGYHLPGGKRRGLAAFAGNTILIVCPNVLNPYYATLVQAIERAARAKRFNTFVYNTYRDVENDLALLGTLPSCGPAGIIFTMMPQAVERVVQVKGTVPVVVIADRNNNLEVDTVELNNYSAGVLIARHMIGLGHKHIAYISTSLKDPHSPRARRRDGVCDTFSRECPAGSVRVMARHITPQEDLNQLLLECSVGHALTLECLSDPDITAFVAVNDFVAYGVLRALGEEGLRVPQDYSVCGFDNLFPSQLPGVNLTTVEHYIAEKGANAFDILYQRITGASDKNITRVEYRHHLLARGSTGPPGRREG